MIEDVETGERRITTVEPAAPDDLRSPGEGWRFDWADAFKTAEVFKLVDPTDPDSALGMMGLIRRRGYVEVVLLESNPAHVGRTKRYRGIAGSLLAFAAQLSFEIGAEGFVAIDSKSELVEHYRMAYGFERLGSSQRMILGTLAAARLIEQYGGRPTHG